jgi:membrane fusion protein, multidrug efflux system
MKSVLGSIALVLLVLGIAAGIGGYKYYSIKAMENAPPPPEMPESVIIGRVEPIQFRPSVTSIGTVLAPQSIDLKTEVAGTIQSIDLESGSLIDQGKVLLKLDDSVEQAQLQGARALVKIAESTFRRTQEAASARAVTELELDQAEAQLSQAKAEVAQLEAIIRKKTLVAPFPARVGLCDWHVGQYLAEGTRITMLQGIQDFIHIDFSMPQKVADSVAVGQSVTLLDEGGNLKASIVAIDSQADRMTRSITARARLDHPPASLQPNDSIKVELEYGQPVQAMIIPSSALRRTPTGTTVFVARRDEKGVLRAHAVPVVPGSSRGAGVVVFQGLNLGQEIVADGSFKLHENSLLLDKTESKSSKAATEVSATTTSSS